MLTNNQIMVLNDAIYKIHTMEDFNEMRIAVLRSLEFIIPSPLLTFYLANPDDRRRLADPVGIADGHTLDPGRPKLSSNIGAAHPAEVSLTQYLDEFEDIDYTRWVFAAPSAKVYRETDFMSDEERMQTEYYKRMYAPAGIHYSIILTLNHQGVFYGCICLYRKRDDKDFTEDEMFILDQLKDHLSYRLALQCGALLPPNGVAVNDQVPDREKKLLDSGLTKRETEIVLLLLDGESREDICEKLFIAPNTLKKHVLHVYKKLGVNSWRELFCMFRD